jgi:hypothetical protein
MLKNDKSPRYVQYVFPTLRQIWNTVPWDVIAGTEPQSKQFRIPKVNKRRELYLWNFGFFGSWI